VTATEYSLLLFIYVAQPTDDTVQCLSTAAAYVQQVNPFDDNVHTLQAHHFLDGRPTYMSTDLYFTTDSYYFLLLFCRLSPSSLNETQPKSATCWEVTAI